MLQELSIRNFAIIDDLRIRFLPGLTILSGETGAGKSIVVGAVNLLLGSRASSDLVRTGAENAELEAFFDLAADSPTARCLQAHDYDPAEGLLVRRIISRQNRHRVYVNGRLATAGLLGQLTGGLASISGQHAHQGLLREDLHLEILDQFGGLLPHREQVRTCHRAVVSLMDRTRTLRQRRERREERRELLEFQRREIAGADLTPGEDEDLERERARLRNAELLYQTVHSCLERLYNAPGAAIEQLVDLQRDLEHVGGIDPQLAKSARRVSESAIQLEDTADELRTYLHAITVDEQRLETVETRLNDLEKLKRKYGGSLEAVARYLREITSEQAAAAAVDDDLEALDQRLGTLNAELGRRCRLLSVRRRKAAGKLARAVEFQLHELKMEHARFDVRMDVETAEADSPSYLVVEGCKAHEAGIDRARFLISPNPGEDLKSLTGIASGGELSRVVLALKALLAATDSVATVVFDEVDAGIGGGVAEVVGGQLADLARRHQVICITHLPQIAKHADHHYRIAKQVVGGRTQTAITALDDEERVREIARMLAGLAITDKTLAHAREMLYGERTDP